MCLCEAKDTWPDILRHAYKSDGPAVQLQELYDLDGALLSQLKCVAFDAAHIDVPLLNQASSAVAHCHGCPFRPLHCSLSTPTPALCIAPTILACKTLRFCTPSAMSLVSMWISTPQAPAAQARVRPCLSVQVATGAQELGARIRQRGRVVCAADDEQCMRDTSTARHPAKPAGE